MPHNLDELAGLIAKRDNLSMFEAQNVMDNCLDLVREAIEENEPLEILEDIVREELGLEPDYLELLLVEAF